MDIFEMDTLAVEPTKKYHNAELLLMLDLINAFGSGFNLIGTLEFKDESQRIIPYELTKSFHSLQCAFRLSISGYYSQTITLLRQLTESWLICKNCKENPKLRAYLLEGKGDRLNYFELAESIGAEKIIYRGDFVFQSKFTHSSSISLGILKERATETLRTNPTYEKMMFLACAEVYIRNVTLMFECMYEFLADIDENMAVHWDKRISKVVQGAGDWQRELRNKYGKPNQPRLNLTVTHKEVA